MEERGQGDCLLADGMCGVPVYTQETPIRGRHKLPDPLCSPIAHHSPRPDGSPTTSPMTPLMAPSPSPGSKRFVGVSSNARNDIYMKTLMNSPYHKSYTPLSATPSGFSPAYQTPIRSKAVASESPQQGFTCTPKGLNQTPSGKKFVTPKNVVVNPFETGIDGLHLPAYMSPGFFSIASTPASEEKKAFRWSIEHIAELNPADIDEMPEHQSQPLLPDKETEERAQRAIEQFFANNIVAPSPWSDPKNKNKKKNILPATPASQGSGSQHAEEMMTELQGSIQKSLPTKQGMQDAVCQTQLSLPLNFDLQKVLGAYMNQDTGEEGNQQEMLSTSSLRRKLFFHGDTSSLAPSPVKGGQLDGFCEPMSPMFVNKGTPHWDRITPLKNTPAFSSSPIKSAGTPQCRRCSSDPEFLASPELSPIVHGGHTRSIKVSRSSDIFEPHHASFDLSPVGQDDDINRHQRSPGSPILFSVISPEEMGDESMRPKFVDSPGFSPIRPPKTPIRKILRKSQEESYIQEDNCSSGDETESVTPVSENPRLQRESNTPVMSPRHRTPRSKMAAFISKSHSCSELAHTAMDFESKDSVREDNILTSSLCDTRDYSSHVDFTDETHLGTNSSSQDTGYQTASLQSTNQESVSLHTNLTNQFSSMPFNVTNQDALFQNTSLAVINQEKTAPILNLTQQFSSLVDEEMESRSYKPENISKSKQQFPRKNLFSQKLFFSDEEDAGDSDTPKTMEPSRLNFDDSALPDELISSKDMSSHHMDIDSKKGLEGLIPTLHEEQVLSRARQALALANNLYPQDRMEVSISKETLVEADLGRLSPITVMSDMKAKGGDGKQSASEIALSIMQRAGADLARYERLTTMATGLSDEGRHEVR